jgi:hypothetical protein
MGLLGVLVLTSCGHVAGNYPVKDFHSESWVKAESPARWSGPRYTIEVGEPTNIKMRTERRKQVLQSMAAVQGEAAVKRMVQQVEKNYPHIHRLYRESEDFNFYRGTIVFHEKGEIEIKEGDFQLVFLVDQDTVVTRDEGIIFLFHDDSNRSCYSADGPVSYSSEFNHEPLGRHNRIQVRSSITGRIISISPVE